MRTALTLNLFNARAASTSNGPTVCGLSRDRLVEPLLPVVVEKKVTGEANVMQLFDITIKGKQTMKVAGCRVINGIVDKNKTARVVRNGETVFEGLSHLTYRL